MYVFIAIIFIAELIVAGFVLYWIIRADKAVKNLDNQVAQYSPCVVASLKNVRIGVGLVQDSIEKVLVFINRKRHEFRQRIINLVLIYAILLVLRVKFKKAAAICQYAMLLKEFWDSVPG